MWLCSNIVHNGFPAVLHVLPSYALEPSPTIKFQGSDAQLSVLTISPHLPFLSRSFPTAKNLDLTPQSLFSMSSAYGAPGPGGFLRPTLPSPPASSFNSPPAGYTILPQARSTPLKPGSAKESSFIDYVDRKLLEISRRYEKRFNADFEDEAMSGIQGRGYESYGELARDLEGVIDVVWVSGTRTGGH